MANEIQRRFIKMRVADTRCPDEIRAQGINDDVVYMLRERIECAHWQYVKDHFVAAVGVDNDEIRAGHECIGRDRELGVVSG